MTWLKKWLAKLFCSVLLSCSLLQPARAESLSLSWDKSPTPSVTGYRIYWSAETTVARKPNSIDVGNVLSYTFAEVVRTPGVRCSFAVTAYDTNDESVYSNIVSADRCPAVSLPGKVEGFGFELK